MARFDDCFDFVMKWEGETFENDANDPGGATKFGIDQGSHPNVSIRNLTRAQAKAIYRREKWDKFRCGEMDAPWDLAVFNASVNPGQGWTPPALQKAVGARVDGFIGPKTIAATNAAGPTQLKKFFALMEAYYNALPLYRKGKPFRKRFGPGWLNRVADVRAEAMESFA